ncbi:MAG: aminopeptidase N [Candidatus Parcubacteria bacterium]|nr:aminopeptidase N [Candidatus Parcubacteria bacterium]
MNEPRKPHELDKHYPEADYIPIGRVDLRFELDATPENETKVTATYRIRRNPKVADNTPLTLDLAPEVKLLSLKINGWVFRHERTGNKLILHGVPNGCKVETVVLIDPKNNTTGEGLYAAGDMLLTQNEPEGFRKIVPYLDMPKVMAPFRTTIIGNKEKYPVILSNGNLVDEGEKNGSHWKAYDLPFPIPSYLFALVAGKLEVLKDSYLAMSGRSVNLEIYADKKDIEKCHHAMDSLKHAMKYDEDWYGYECDVDDYKIVATPYFNMGAMENKGLNIFNVSCVLASPETAADSTYEHVEGVIGHEYFHNWTGNRITNVDWRELGVKESITVRRDCLFSKDYRGWGLRKEIDDVSSIRSGQFSEDAGPNRHAIRPEVIKEPNNMYTSTVYQKGAEVYKMLEGIIGRDGFLKGMKFYAKRHDGQATRIEDVMRCMEEANDVDLYQFRNWFTQSGTPTVTIVSEYDEALQKLRLLVKQETTPLKEGKELEPFDIPFSVGFIGKKGEINARAISGDYHDGTLRITQKEQEFVFACVSEKPVLSLNRNFAPVKVKYEYAGGELAHLMAYDTSLFARWDASQTYGAQVLLKLVEDAKVGRTLVLEDSFIQAFGSILREKSIDKNLLAEMMCLPGSRTLSNMSEKVDPHAIHKARTFAYRVLARMYRKEFERLYKENRSDFDAELSFDPESVARRSVANTALGYLTELDVNEVRIFGQYARAKGMSDKYTALSCLVDRVAKYGFSNSASDSLHRFYEQFKGDNNVTDMWFAVQAYSEEKGAIGRVKALMNHPDFDINNPNRVRALVGAFAGGNAKHFHTKEGYAFLTDFLIGYAPKNDIVASRMVSSLTNWKRYIPRLQEMMKTELLRLKEELLKVPMEKVKGTMEKIEKSLAQ